MQEPARSPEVPGETAGAQSSSADISHLRRHWPWILGLGILLDVLGVAALGSASVLSVRWLGWLLMAVGAIRACQALCVRRAALSFIEVATALLYVLVGVLLVARAGAAGATVTHTMAIAVLLMLDGGLHAIGALMTRYPQWQWLLAYSLLVLLFGLGLAVWRQFSHLRVFAIAWFLGITMLINGWSLIATSWPGKEPTQDAP